MRQGCPSQMHHTHHQALEGLGENVGAVLQKVPGISAMDVGDDDIRCAEGLTSKGHGPLDVGLAGQVCAHPDSHTSVGADGRHGFIQGLLTTSHHHYSTSLDGEHLAAGPAYTLAAARDQRNTSIQSKLHGSISKHYCGFRRTTAGRTACCKSPALLCFDARTCYQTVAR
ncbi:hypothetical protein D3C80_1468160 [compost metagenome]